MTTLYKITLRAFQLFPLCVYKRIEIRFFVEHATIVRDDYTEFFSETHNI